MATHTQHGASSLKVRLFNSIGLQSDSPVRSATLPTATSASRFYSRSDGENMSAGHKVVKEGWLRKQSGLLMRSWQARWFVLRNGMFIQYMTGDEGQSPISHLVLSGYRVKELPADNGNEEQTKFLFELSQGTSGSNSSLKVQESLILSAESEENRRDWMYAIKQALYRDNGGAIFGQSLDITMVCERERNKFRQVPEIVELCIEHLRAEGMTSEGIFRLPGRIKIVRELREAFDVGGPRPSFRGVDVHTVASLLKAYLRELPHPIIPVSHYDDVMKIVTRQRPLDRTGALAALTVALSKLPRNNRVLLEYLCKFLREVSFHSDVNKMDASNLATVFSPYCIEPEVDDPALLAGTSANRTTAVMDMITEFDQLFRAEENPVSCRVSEGSESYDTCSEYVTPETESEAFEDSSSRFSALSRKGSRNAVTESDVGNHLQQMRSSNGAFPSQNLRVLESDDNCLIKEMLRDHHSQENNEVLNFLEATLQDESARSGSRTESDIHQQVVTLKQKLLAQDRLVADLRRELNEERSRAAKESQELHRRLAEERDATADAVQRVIELQSKLEKYNMKYGPLYN